MSPRWLYWPASSVGTDLIEFTVSVSSPSNESNLSHTNLTADSKWDGRGTGNSVSIIGSQDPDWWLMRWENTPAGTALRDSALAEFSAWTLLNTSTSVSYSLSASSYSTDAIRFDSTENSLWVATNTYRLIGTP